MQKLAKQPMDDWFKFLGENHIGELLRLYAQVCNHRLAPYLTQVIQDRSLLDPGDSQPAKQQQQQSATIPVPDTMPATPDVLTTKPESVGRSHRYNHILMILFWQYIFWLGSSKIGCLLQTGRIQGARLPPRAQRRIRPLLIRPVIQHRPRKPQATRHRLLRPQVRTRKKSNLRPSLSILSSLFR